MTEKLPHPVLKIEDAKMQGKISGDETKDYSEEHEKVENKLADDIKYPEGKVQEDDFKVINLASDKLFNKELSKEEVPQEIDKLDPKKIAIFFNWTNSVAGEKLHSESLKFNIQLANIIKSVKKLLKSKEINNKDALSYYHIISDYYNKLNLESSIEERQGGGLQSTIIVNEAFLLISEFEYFLKQNLELSPIDYKQREIIVNKAKDLTKTGSYTGIHSTEAEALAGLWRNQINSEGDDMVSRVDYFGDRTHAWWWVKTIIENIPVIKERLLTDNNFFLTTKNLIEHFKKIRITRRRGGSITLSAEKESFDVENIEAEKLVKQAYKLSPTIAGHDRGESDIPDVRGHHMGRFYVYLEEYLYLQENNFLKNDIKKNREDQKTVDILAQMWLRFSEGGRRPLNFAAPDMELLISANRSELTWNYYSHVATISTEGKGKDAIKGIIAASPYSLQKILDFFKTEYGDDYEKYPPIFDIDYNLIWPERVEKKELTLEKS